MAYFLAPALVSLRSAVNDTWPNRDKSSDGWIGDTSHQARPSDHNPDYSSGGIVRAIDITNNGIDVDRFVAAVIADPRTAYVISRGRIWQRPGLYSSSGWMSYSGTNGHYHHVHVSIRRAAAFDRDHSPWNLGAGTVSNPIGGGGSGPGGVNVNPPTPIQEDDMFEDGDRTSLNEVRRMLAVLLQGTPPATAGEIRSLEAMHQGPSEARRMLGVLLGWLAPQGPEVSALAKLYGGTPPAVVDVDEAELARLIAASIPATVAKQVADELHNRLAA